MNSLKSWPNGLARRHKSTQVYDLRFVWSSPLRWLAMTCVDFGWAQIRTQDTGWSQINCTYVREIYGLLRLAYPFGQPLQVHAQVLALQNCVALHRLASPFGQSSKLPVVYKRYCTYLWTSAVANRFSSDQRGSLAFCRNTNEKENYRTSTEFPIRTIYFFIGDVHNLHIHSL